MANTNWQAYSGESTLSYLVQMLGLTVKIFVSATTGLAVLLALIRGCMRKKDPTLSSFWTDLTRAKIYVLLPLSIVLALALAAKESFKTSALMSKPSRWKDRNDCFRWAQRLHKSLSSSLGPTAADFLASPVHIPLKTQHHFQIFFRSFPSC